ncbi:MAG TPA: DUF5320 domain-containing protein [Clostridia bacterium]|nr:DUF5320 domain-containing protein [Clostridia bacterium]
MKGVVMPFRDETGPCGEGRLTGRGLGPCNSNNENTEENDGQSTLGLGIRRMGRFPGRGRGRGNGRRQNWR